VCHRLRKSPLRFAPAAYTSTSLSRHRRPAGGASAGRPSKLSNWPEIDSTLDKELTAFQNGQETAAAATARIAPIVNSLLKEGQPG
jgi:hypothetical protein